MPPKQVNIQPRNTPPKPHERDQQFAQADAQAKALAAQAPEAPREIITGPFPEPHIAALPKAPEPIPSQVDLPTLTPSPVAGNSVLLTPSEQERPVPPRTRQEYTIQQRAIDGQGEYPDVADIFVGKIPGETPSTGYLKTPSKPAPAPQPQKVEVVVKHELPEEARAYKVLQQRSAYIGDTFRVFQKDEIIYEVYVIDELLRGHADWIAPLMESKDWETCPRCSHTFPPTRPVAMDG
jgi:hypothetical protein